MSYTPQLKILQTQGGGIYTYHNLTFDLSNISDAATSARVAQALDVGLQAAAGGGTTFDALILGLQSNGPRTISFYDGVGAFEAATGTMLTQIVSTSSYSIVNGNDIWINPTGGSWGFTQPDGSIRPSFGILTNDVWHELMHADGLMV